jgi:hypothetical protein
MEPENEAQQEKKLVRNVPVVRNAPVEFIINS